MYALDSGAAGPLLRCDTCKRYAMDPSGSQDDREIDPRSQLFRAIADLPDDVREVTRLVLVERRSEEEAAEELELEPEEVRRRLEAGRERLLEELDVEELTKWLR